MSGASRARAMTSAAIEAIDRMLPVLATLGAVLILAYTVHRHLQDGGVGAQPATVQNARQDVVSAPASAVAYPFPDWHPFGNGQQPTTGTPAAIREAQSALVLRGVFFGRSVSSGRAIIVASDGSERQFRTGDTLPDGTVLQALDKHRVIIRRGTTLEAISLPRAEEPAAGPRPAGDGQLPAEPAAPTGQEGAYAAGSTAASTSDATETPPAATDTAVPGPGSTPAVKVVSRQQP